MGVTLFPKNLNLILMIISMPLLASAKQQLVVVKNANQVRAITFFASQNNATLQFRGHLSFGDLYLLDAEKDYQPMDLFIANQESKVLVAENSSIHIGPALIGQTQPSQINLFLNAEKDMSMWQWGFHNDGSNAPEQEGRVKPSKGIIGYDAQVLEAWEQMKPPKKQVVVAVIDSGIDVLHTELKDHLWVNEKEFNGSPGVDDDGNGFVDDINGYSFVDNSASLKDEHGHGTHCSGVIAADHDNNIGVKGLAPGVKVLAVKIFDKNGSGPTEYAIKAIDYAVKMKVDVISASWGGGPLNEVLKAAIENAARKNILFVAAAGNDGTDNDVTPFYPANYDLENIVSVAAHHNAGNLAAFSNFGLKKVHISAPGQYILSTLPGNKYAVWSGTSMATPHVSAAIALLLEQEGNLPIAEIKDRLMQSSLPQLNWRKSLISLGRLNVLGLLQNTKISRGLPLETEWKIYAPQVPLYETNHPLSQSELWLVKDFQVPDAKFVRFVVSKTDFFGASGVSVNIRDPKTKSEFEQLPLKLEKIYKTDYVVGDSIGFRLNLDSPGSWGMRIDAIEYQ